MPTLCRRPKLWDADIATVAPSPWSSTRRAAERYRPTSRRYVLDVDPRKQRMTDDDDDWRFAVEDVGDADEDDGDAVDESDAEDLPGGPEGPEEHPPLEPGSPSLENALFVLLGVFLTLFMIVRVAALVAG
jgi:hypothetical protein